MNEIQCSFCKKFIDKDAIVCPYCREQPNRLAVWAKIIAAIFTVVVGIYALYLIFSL